MASVKHSLRYRIWNQNRLAKHTDDYFQVLDELTAESSNLIDPARSTITIASRVLLKMVVVQLATIKGKQGVGLCKLIDEAERTGAMQPSLAALLKAEIDVHAKVLNNICRQRNNIIAHRSEELTFKEVNEKYPVSKDDLRPVVAMYYDVSRRMNAAVPFQNSWSLEDCRQDARAMLTLLQSPDAPSHLGDEALLMR